MFSLLFAFHLRYDYNYRERKKFLSSSVRIARSFINKIFYFSRLCNFPLYLIFRSNPSNMSILQFFFEISFVEISFPNNESTSSLMNRVRKLDWISRSSWIWRRNEQRDVRSRCWMEKLNTHLSEPRVEIANVSSSIVDIDNSLFPKRYFWPNWQFRFSSFHFRFVPLTYSFVHRWIHRKLIEIEREREIGMTREREQRFG